MKLKAAVKKDLLAFLKNHWKFILLSAGYFVSRLIFLDTDFHILEPDEGIYYGQVNIFSQQINYTFPLSSIVASWLYSLTNTWGALVHLRLLSVLGGFLVGVGLYSIGKSIKNQTIAIFSPLLFWLLPLSFFYTRSGTSNMFSLGWAVLSLGVFIASNKGSEVKNGVLSGILFVISILAKLSSTIFLFGFLSLYLLDKENFKKVLSIFVKTVVILLSMSLVILYVTYGRILFSSVGVFLHPTYNPELSLSESLFKFGWYLSPPVLLLLFIGIAMWFCDTSKRKQSLTLEKGQRIFERLKQVVGVRKPALPSIVSLLIPSVISLLLFNPSPEYFLILTPLVALLGGYVLSRFSYHLLKVVFILAIIPWTYTAFMATNHISLRSIKKTVEEIMANNTYLPIYSTVDPESLSFYLDQPVSLLSKNALNGGVIITDVQSTDLTLHSSDQKFLEAREVLSLLPDRKKVFTYTDPYNHFPVSPEGNVFTIYLIPSSFSGESSEDVEFFKPFNTKLHLPNEN